MISSTSKKKVFSINTNRGFPVVMQNSFGTMTKEEALNLVIEWHKRKITALEYELDQEKDGEGSNQTNLAIAN